MNKENKISKLFILFITFLKIGLFTFGGGYAMIPIIEEEVGTKKKWLNNIELLDILAISESTPGPIAVNCATYVGYKVAGILGGIFATLGLAVPSFLIILILSFFYKDFMNVHIIQAAFKGLKIGVILLLIKATIKLSKNFKFSFISILLFIVSLILMLSFSFFNISFNYLSLCLILFGLIIGVCVLTPKGEERQ